MTFPAMNSPDERSPPDDAIEMISQATAPPTIPRDAQDVEMLLRFLRERDVPCPRCGYNLRNLTQPVCPECREELVLLVARREAGFGWLVLGLVPGAFSGLAAALLLMVIVTVFISPTGRIPWPFLVIEVFGWFSGLLAIGLYVKRDRFLRMTEDRQRAWAIIIWSAHVAMFILFVSVMWLL